MYPETRTYEETFAGTRAVIGKPMFHPQATRSNGSEMLVAFALLLVSGLAWAHVVGTVVGIIATFNPEKISFHSTMDELNSYMANEGVPLELRYRAREYFHKSKHLKHTLSHGDLL